MNEMVLSFTRTAQGLEVRLVDLQGEGDGPTHFESPLSDADDADLTWYFRDYLDVPRDGSLARAARIEGSLPRWGRALYDAVLATDERRRSFAAWMALPSSKCLTIVADDPDVLRVPWELLQDEHGPLFQQGIRIRRRLLDVRLTTVDASHRLRILFIVSRPDDMDLIDPRPIAMTLADIFGPLGNEARIEMCHPPTISRFREMLETADEEGAPYTILHFDGHGIFSVSAQRGALCFEEERQGDRVDHTELEAVEFGELAAQFHIPLVVLGACHSGAVSRLSVFASIAPRLLAAGVRSIVAMSETVHVDAIRIFMSAFYGALVSDSTVGQAVEMGRIALSEQAERRTGARRFREKFTLQDWFIPTLYQQGNDFGFTRTAPVDAEFGATRAKWASKGELGAFPEPSRYTFRGRSAMLIRLERLLAQQSPVVLHAMAGMGKTSLARETAWWLTRTGRFADGACFVPFDEPGGVERAVRTLGVYLDGEAFAALDFDEQWQRARILFQTHQVLVVWDAFEYVLPEFQELHGLPWYSDDERSRLYALIREWHADIAGGSRLLLTSRSVHVGFDRATTLRLPSLSRPDAHAFLWEVMAPNVVGDAGEEWDIELDTMLNLLQNHPYSIEIVGFHVGTNEGKVHPFKIIEGFARQAEFARDADMGGAEPWRISAELSKKLLRSETRAALQALEMFRVGVFEDMFLEITSIPQEVWAIGRSQLERVALIETVEELLVDGKPYLRFHPSLTQMRTQSIGAEPEIKRRFVKAYLSLTRAAYEANDTGQPTRGVLAVQFEEANIRTALAWATELGLVGLAIELGTNLATALRLAGRQREHDTTVRWLVERFDKETFSTGVVKLRQYHAMALMNQGKPREAVACMKELVEQLQAVSDPSAAELLAGAWLLLGIMQINDGFPLRAIDPLQRAFQWYRSQIGVKLEAGEEPETECLNLAACAGNLTSALIEAGLLDNALGISNITVQLMRTVDDLPGLVSALLRHAAVLRMQGRLGDASEVLREAADCVVKTGNRDLSAGVLRSQADHFEEMGQFDKAIERLQKALQIFIEMRSEDRVLETMVALATSFHKQGLLHDARAWYLQALDLAKKRKDGVLIGVIIHNLGLSAQHEGQVARSLGNEAAALEWFAKAASTLEDALKLRIAREDAPRAAETFSQLGILHIHMSQWDVARKYAQQARMIREKLQLREVIIDYESLHSIAKACGDTAGAREWEGKLREFRDELKKRSGVVFASSRLLEELRALCISCLYASADHTPLADKDENAIRALATRASPLRELAEFFQSLSTHGHADVPPGLPVQISDMLEDLLRTWEMRRSTT